MKSYLERRLWLLTTIKQEGCGVDILNRDFVDSYIEFSGAKFTPMIIGASQCRLLAADLSKMAKAGLLDKRREDLGKFAPTGDLRK